MKQCQFFRLILLSAIISFCMCYLPACTTTKHPVEVVGASETEVQQAIADDRWIFVANQVMPQSGRSRILTTRYTMLCNKDTILSALPYFGRAYSAPIGETKSPLDFTSANFVLTKNVDKKGRWNVTIKPNDYSEVQSYIFTLFTNGSAQLNVQMKSRSPISFSGTVAPIK